MHACMQVMYVCIYVCMYGCIHTYIQYASMHVSVYICICVSLCAVIKMNVIGHEVVPSSRAASGQQILRTSNRHVERWVHFCRSKGSECLCSRMLSLTIALSHTHTLTATQTHAQSHKHMHMMFPKHDFARTRTHAPTSTRAHKHTQEFKCMHTPHAAPQALTNTPTHIYAHTHRAFVAASFIPRQRLRRHAQEDHSRVWLSQFASYERVMLWVTCSEILGFSPHQ